MSVARDIVTFCGLASICAGAWMIYPPVAFILAGMFFTVLGIYGEMRSFRPTLPDRRRRQ